MIYDSTNIVLFFFLDSQCQWCIVRSHSAEFVLCIPFHTNQCQQNVTVIKTYNNYNKFQAVKKGGTKYMFAMHHSIYHTTDLDESVNLIFRQFVTSCYCSKRLALTFFYF